MTISTTIIKSSANGNGSTSAFTYSFKITDDDDIQVIIRSSTGIETVKSKGTHYNVAGVGNNSGTVTFTSGNIPASGETVVLRRSTTQTQAMDLIDNDPMSANTIETAHDKSIAINQELQEQLDRSIKISRTNTMTSTEFTTSATDRANKVLSFNASGELDIAQELGTFKGNWAASTAYKVRDIVKDTSTNNIFIVITAHTSSGSQPLTTNTDSAKWSLIVDAASATTSQNAAAASATASANSATASASSATASANSATASAASETNSANSATASANSATASASSATSAAASFDSFDDRYLGAKSSNPSTDNDGNSLITGAIYFNTSSNQIFSWTGSAWVAIKPTSSEQTNINALAASAVIADMAILGTTDVVNDMNILTTTDVVADMNTLATSDVVTDMNTLGTADVVNDMNVLGTSANVTAMNLLGTSTVVADMALLGTTDVVADMALLANADVISDMNTLATTDIVSDLNTLATSDIVSDLNTLATSDIVSDINTLATSDIVSDLNTLATSDIVSDINTLATSDIVTDLNLLATSDFVSDLNTLATSTNVTNIDNLNASGVLTNIANLNGSGVLTNIANLNASGVITNIGAVAGIASAVTAVNNNSSNINSVNSNSTNINLTAGSIGNVNNVGGSIANVNTAATNLSGINSFAERYRVGSSDPGSNNDAGDLFYNTNANSLKYFDGSNFQTIVAGSLTDIVQDGSPQLGGNLDTQSFTVDGRDVSTDGSKLDGIEASATADQTNAEIRTAVEAASDSNVFTDADHSKLNAIEASATADQTDAEIRAAVEAASNSNVFTDADHTKLNGIASSATANANAIDNVVEDTTPQLGGNLDLNSKNITGTGGIPSGNLTGTIAEARLPASALASVWESKSSNFTAAARKSYFVDTSSNAVDVTLPSGSIGDTIRFLDVSGTFDTNDLTILNGSSKIQGASANLDISTERAGFALVYYNSTQGWLLEDK